MIGAQLGSEARQYNMVGPVQHGWVLPVISLQMIIYSEGASPYCLPVSGVRKQYTECQYEMKPTESAIMPSYRIYIYIGH